MDSKFAVIDRLMQKFPGVHKDIIMSMFETAGGDEDVCTGLCMSMLSEWSMERAKADRGTALRSSASDQPRLPPAPTGAMASSAPPPTLHRQYAWEIEQLRQLFPDVGVDRITKVVGDNAGNIDMCLDAFLPNDDEPPVSDSRDRMGCGASPMLWSKRRVVDVVDVDDDTDNVDTSRFFPNDRVHHKRGLQKGGLAEVGSDRDIPSIGGRGLQIPDNEEDEDATFRECVARWCEMFPTIPETIVANVVSKNAESNRPREEQENATYNNLKKQEKKQKGDMPKEEEKRGNAAHKQPPQAVVPSPTTGNTATSTNRHHFHIFWDFDNVHSLSHKTKQQRVGPNHYGWGSPIHMLSAMKEYFADINPNTKKNRGSAGVGAHNGNVVRLEGYFVPASHVSQFELTTLRNLGLKVVMCSQKSGDADRQIKKNILQLLDLLSMGLPSTDHTVVVVSADQDFTDCAEQVQHMGYRVWCVHNAASNSAHENVLRLMYDRVVSVADLPKPQ